jgi:hypothetical protein
LILGLIFVFSSCANLPPIRGERSASFGFSKDWREEAGKRKVRSGTVFFEAKREGSQPIRAPGILIVQWPDSIRLELEDPIGGVQALFLSQGGRFWWYRADAPSIVTGPVASLPETLGLATSPAELVAAFLARPTPSGNGSGLWQQTSRGFWESGKDLLEEEAGQPLTWTRKGEWKVTFSHWEAQGGLRWPKRTHIADLRPGEREWQVEWREWEGELPPSKNPFLFPSEGTFGRPIKVLP